MSERIFNDINLGKLLSLEETTTINNFEDSVQGISYENGSIFILFKNQAYLLIEYLDFPNRKKLLIDGFFVEYSKDDIERKTETRVSYDRLLYIIKYLVGDNSYKEDVIETEEEIEKVAIQPSILYKDIAV